MSGTPRGTVPPPERGETPPSRRLGLATRMLLIFGLGSTLLFSLIQGYEYVQTLRTLRGVSGPDEAFLEAERALQRDQFLLAGAGLVALSALALAGARTVSRPLGELSGAAERIAGGDLTTPVPALRGPREVESLAAAFETMRGDLIRRIAQGEAAAAERARTEGELAIARQTQMSFLPGPIPSDARGFDLAGGLWPAREVGGDLYDYFPLPGGEWALLIGDVSDKGVPAALWMTATQVLVRGLARQTPSPGEVLSRLNDLWAERNETCRFLTAVCLFANPLDGRIRYARAGHPPPLLRTPSGALRPLPPVTGPLLGALPGLRFEEAEARMGPGEILLLYTDGVTEARNPQGAFLGEERLADLLARADGGAGCAALVRDIREAVEAFADGAPQSDDIALLACRLRPDPAEAGTGSREGPLARTP